MVELVAGSLVIPLPMSGELDRTRLEDLLNASLHKLAT
jgi:hypothetical protein